MALQVGELYSLLELDTGPFDNAMGGVKGKLKGLGGMVGKAALGVGAVLAGAFTAAGVAGVKANSDTEQFMATMEVLTGSTEKASAELAKLKQFAATTPFSMEDLKRGELTMRAVGVSTEKWRDAIGDTAAAFGSTGKSYVDVVDAIADAQTGELERLKEFGITKNQIIEYGEKEMRNTSMVNAKGQITDQEAFNDAILGIMKDRYSGMMDKQSKTMLGMLDTFKDFTSQGLEIMSKPIFEVLKKGMDAALPALENMMDSGMFERIGQQVANFVDAVMTGFSRIIPMFSQGGNVFQTVFGVLKRAFETVRPQIELFGAILPQVFLSVVKAFQYVKPQIQLFGEIAVQIFQRVMKIVQSVMTYIAPLIVSTIGMIVSWWKANGTELLKNAQIVFNGILTAVEFVMPAIKFIIDIVFSAIKMIIGGALQFIGGIFRVFAGLFTGDWSKMWQGIKDVVIGAIKFVLGLMQLNFVRGMFTAIKTLGTQSVTGIKAMWTKIVSTFEGFIQKVITGSGNMVKSLLGWFRSLWTQTQTIFSILRAFGEGIFRAMFNTIRSTVSNAVATVRGNFSNMVNSIKGSLSNLWSSVTTRFNAIKTAMTNPIQAAKTAISRAVDGIKSIFSNLKLKLPQIKVPKFSIKNWSSNPKDWIGAMPSIGISWNKNGGIFNGPTVAGLGEAGPEAIVPLSGQRMRPFAQEIARQMGGAVGSGQIYVNATLVLPDGRVIAEIAEPHIQEIQDLNAKKQKRGWGAY